jgi:POT family proton-dependent oligopeptide transporter
MILTYQSLIALSIDPLLVWNYGSMGVICGISGIFFWLSVRKLDKQEDALNNLQKGTFGMQDEKN